jgi:hypothetical protein
MSKTSDPEQSVSTAQLKGRNIIIKVERVSKTTKSELTRLAVCVDGNGCDPRGMGRMIYVRFLSNPAWGQELVPITRDYIERFATKQEVALATD